jgi:hypothetical protein
MPSTHEIDKRITTLRGDREKLEDHRRALLGRVEAAKNEAAAARRVASQARAAAIDKLAREAREDATLAFKRYELADAIAVALYRRV